MHQDQPDIEAIKQRALEKIANAPDPTTPLPHQAAINTALVGQIAGLAYTTGMLIDFFTPHLAAKTAKSKEYKQHLEQLKKVRESLTITFGALDGWAKALNPTKKNPLEELLQRFNLEMKDLIK